MHCHIDISKMASLSVKRSIELCNKTVNIYAPWRSIYFFSDAPHFKTGRNCWASSGAGKCSRYMWHNGKHILWTHLSRLFMEELSTCSTKILSKVTLQHIQLTSYSVMTVTIALRKYGGDEASETANFCSLWDQFFDCLNRLLQYTTYG